MNVMARRRSLLLTLLLLPLWLIIDSMEQLSST